MHRGGKGNNDINWEIKTMSQKNIKETGKRESIQSNIKCDYTEEELMRMTRSEIIAPLTDREVAFCEFYIQDFNLKIAMYKAGFSAAGANFKLKHQKDISNYLEWLKIRAFSKTLIKAEDIINAYAKQAFYNINDYIEITNNGKVKLRSPEQLDGTLIQEISVNNSGSFTVKFPDRQKALSKLEDYIPDLPAFSRQVEERKLRILEERLEIDKQKNDYEAEMEDDNFIEALNNVAKGIFEEEQEQ